jgi:hypothetical protein
MRVIGIATKPAEPKNITTKDKRQLTVWEIPVLDESLNTVVTVQAWSAENPWPKAQRGAPIDALVTKINSSTTYGMRATLAEPTKTA